MQSTGLAFVQFVFVLHKEPQESESASPSNHIKSSFLLRCTNGQQCTNRFRSRLPLDFVAGKGHESSKGHANTHGSNRRNGDRKGKRSHNDCKNSSDAVERRVMNDRDACQDKRRCEAESEEGVSACVYAC